MAADEPGSTNAAGGVEPTTRGDTVPGGTRCASADAATRNLPGTIGTYRILSELGRGGMGIVYEAQQRHPRRRVALKVVRGERHVDRTYLRLFDREALTLARLKHPGIAAIYEAGCTEDGHHFFAMELVQGMALDAYVRSRRLARRERLKLFREICEAINYAHQRGVIHRDLKPSNILVDADGHPKVLDFGLARITEADIAAVSVKTEVGQIQGTLTHMSPEQARGNPDEIDLRTDVYALGVILYELMTETLPFGVAGASLHQALVTICEAPPPRPRSVDRGIGGDLETIILKALAKEPGQRYQSAAALADDVERYLTDLPILARPPSGLYQLRKLVLRHKTASGLLATIIVLLATFGVWTRVLFVRAESEARTATWVKDFMVGLFRIADPNLARGDTVTARDLLDRGAGRIVTDFESQPRIQAELMDAMVTAYRNLGLYEEAEQLALASLETRRSALPSDEAALARSLLNLGWVLKREGELEQAEPFVREALELNRRQLPANDPLLADNLHLLGTTLASMERLEEARAAIAEALAIRRQTGSLPDVADALIDLSDVTQKLGDREQAERLVREALDIRSAQGDDQAPRNASAKTQLASLLRDRGDYEAAAVAAREALAIRRGSYDESHAYVASSLVWLGLILRDSGDLPTAETHLRAGLERYRALFGENNRYVASTRNQLGWVLFDRGAYGEAESCFREAEETYRQRGSLGKRSATLESSLGLGQVALARGENERAEALLREVASAWREAYGKESWRTASAESALGDCLRRLGRLDEAEALLVRSHGAMEALRGPDDRYVQEALQRLAELYDERGMTARAATLRVRLSPSGVPGGR